MPTLFEPAACEANVQTTLLWAELVTAHGTSPMRTSTSTLEGNGSNLLPESVKMSPPLPVVGESDVTTGVAAAV